MQTPDGSAVTVERLWPSGWTWAVVVLLAAFCGAVVLRFSTTGALVAFLVSAAAMAGALVAVTPTVGVVGDEFVAGRARVPVALLGPATALDAEGMRHAIGVGLDARSYLCVRGWIRPGLKVALFDPADPTPSWIVSSRHPQRLAAALEAAGGATRGRAGESAR